MEELPENKTVYVKKIVLLGEVAVGKTSIGLRFAKDEFSPAQESTVGAVFLPKKLELKDLIIEFEIWDTAGQERFRALAPMYYKGAKAAIVVYDIQNYDSFDKAKHWINELFENASSDILILMVGNKADLEDNRNVDTNEAQEYANKNGIYFFEASAKTSYNISNIFDCIANNLTKIKQSDKNIKIDDKLQVQSNQKYCQC